jgi:Ca-activated chloride channel family protein
MIAPRTEVTESEIAAKEVLFVFDTSGSMAGDAIERAKGALDYMLARLRPTDRFQVVRFSTDVEALFDGGASVPATPANVASARRFASGFVAAGGTAIDAALHEGLRTRGPHGQMPRMVVFLTDGMPTIGETIPQRILENVRASAGDARLFVFGVGDDVNTTFLDQLAQANGGVGDYFRDGSEMERRLSSFYDRIAYPLFTDLRLEIPGLSSFDVYPRDLAHLYRGEQLLVVGRYRGEGTRQVRLTGRASNEREPRTFAFDVSFASSEPDNDWLPRLWATRKIGFLLDEIRLRGERAELRTEVVALAQRFGIVTPYTSYLVVEDEAVPPELAQQAQAQPRVMMPFRAADPTAGNSRRMSQPAEPAPSPEPPPADGRGDFDGFRDATTSYDFEDDAIGGDMERPEASGVRARPGRHRVTVSQAPSTGGSGAGSAPAGATGERGRNIARRLRTMREAEQTSSAAVAGTRFVDGRSFRLVSGMWVDSSYRRSMPTLRVRYGSDGYFALLRVRPDLRRALALGERVTVALPGGRAVIIDAAAPASVSEADVRRFLVGP